MGVAEKRLECAGWNSAILFWWSVSHESETLTRRIEDLTMRQYLVHSFTHERVPVADILGDNTCPLAICEAKMC